MNPKAIRDLAQFPDDQLRLVVAEGLELLHSNMGRLVKSANKLAGLEDEQSRRILLSIAEEEAGKYLILLDAIRCPRNPPHLLGEHLRKFYDHLARGIYCKVCAWRPADFAEIMQGVAREREAFYLDGPNDVDFIYRNQILSDREEAIYVDFSLIEGEHQWVAPLRTGLHLFGSLTSAGIKRVHALHQTGIGKPEALGVIAKTWHVFTFDANTHYQEFREQNLNTLKAVEAAGFLEACDNSVYAEVINEWPFPMYKLDLSLTKTKPAQLESIRDRWSTDA